MSLLDKTCSLHDRLLPGAIFSMAKVGVHLLLVYHYPQGITLQHNDITQSYAYTDLQYGA